MLNLKFSTQTGVAADGDVSFVGIANARRGVRARYRLLAHPSRRTRGRAEKKSESSETDKTRQRDRTLPPASPDNNNR